MLCADHLDLLYEGEGDTPSTPKQPPECRLVRRSHGVAAHRDRAVVGGALALVPRGVLPDRTARRRARL
jgi:hypothetical protein